MARVRILLEYDGPEKEVDLAESLASGPTSSHLRVTGTPSAAPDSNGHFLFDRADPGQRESFDAAHMFAVAHDAIRMVRHELGASGGWAWGNGPGAALLLAAHRHPPEVTHYSRKHRTVFFSRPPGSDDGGKLFECRSLETVAHEVAHAVLDGLHPDWHVSPLHTEPRALHEAFGDITGMFLALSHPEIVRSALSADGSLAAGNTFAVFGERRQSTGAEPGARRLDTGATIAEALQRKVPYPGLGQGFDFHYASTVVSGLVYTVFVGLATSLLPAAARPEDAYTQAGDTLRGIVIGAFGDVTEPRMSLVVQAMRRRAEQAAGTALADAVENEGRHRGLLQG